MVVILSHPPLPEAFRHFLDCMGWSDWKHPHTLFDAYLWSVSICGQGSASERRLSAFFPNFFLSGYHCYHRELGHKLPFFFLSQPHHGRILGRIF